MTINSNTSFGKLKCVVVGRELELKKRVADFAFAHFYKENLGHAVYDKIHSQGSEYYVNYELVQERIEDLENLSKLIDQLGVCVLRPERLTEVVPFKTPHFNSELSSASNVRDLTLIYRDFIIETPVYVRNRYFENLQLYNVFQKEFQKKSSTKWIKAPYTKLTEETMDLLDWNTERNYKNFDREKYVMAIDGAQFLRIGRDVIVNVNSYNHFLGFEWLSSFFPETDFHIVNIADNHIDGALICLRPGTFLVNPLYRNIKDKLPKKFSNWEYIYPDDISIEPRITTGMTNLDIQLASSRGMDINVLSLDEKRVFVNETATNVCEILNNNGFDVIPVKLRHSEIFGGGIHCSTLDLHREDEYAYYC